MKKNFKKLLFIAMLCILPTAYSDEPQKISVGMYINEINVNLRDNSFTADFWLWYLWDDDNIKPYTYFEIVNGTIQTEYLLSVRKINGSNYAIKRIKAVFKNYYDSARFPLDDEDLKITIEDPTGIDNNTIVMPDHNNSRVDKSLHIPGFNTVGFQAIQTTHTYNSNFGTLSNKGETYPRIEFIVDLKRTSISIFFKMFSGFFISILIALAAFNLRPDVTGRFGLSGAAIFSSVSNSLVLKNYIAESNIWTLTDKIGLTTLFVILIIIVVSSYSLKLFQANREEERKRLDLFAPIFLGIAYFICIAGYAAQAYF